MEKKAFGEAIKHFRKLNGWNQEELSEKLNMAQQTVSSWECGNSYPDIEDVEALCQCFGISENILFDKGREITAKKKNNLNKIKIIGAITLLVGLSLLAYITIFHKSKSGNIENKKIIEKNEYYVEQHMVDRVVYDDYDKLYNDADLIVIGRFEQEDETKLIKEYDAAFEKKIVTDAIATNVLTVEKVIKGNAETGEVTIAQRYGYDDENNKLITFSSMTPMEKGTEWVYFLKYDESSNRYFTLGDYTGRYPVADGASFGVYSEVSVNMGIYRRINELIDNK